MKSKNTLILTLSLALFGLVLSASAHCGVCGVGDARSDDAKDQQQLQDAEAHQHGKSGKMIDHAAGEMGKADRTQETAGSHGHLSPLLEAYFPLQQALAADDLDAAKTHAPDLERAAEGVNQDLVSYARLIANTDSIDAARTAFKKASQHMVRMMERLGDNDTDVYLAFCPMAFGNTGAYWLQNSGKLMNPYYGSRMLHCGSIQRASRAVLAQYMRETK